MKTGDEGRRRIPTHSHDDKVQPAPGVGKVTNVAHGQPLGQHLEYENDGESAIHVM